MKHTLILLTSLDCMKFIILTKNFWLVIGTLALFNLTLAGCSSSNHSASITGTVLSADAAVSKAQVKLFSTGKNNGKTSIASATTDQNGIFQLVYSTTAAGDDGILFITTSGGKISNTSSNIAPQYALAVAIASANNNQQVIINDRTTVATAFAMAQFVQDNGISGVNPGLSIAAGMIANVVDIETGEPGPTILNDDNVPSSDLSTVKKLNEMSNLIASCATDETTCQSIMQLALALDDSQPADTFHALVNMAKNPWRDPVPLFNLITSNNYQQDLGNLPPTAWTLSFKFKGDPVKLAGPGNMAFDADGQMWIINNLVTDTSYVLPDCASQLLFKMDPTTGKVETYTGGGLDGAGYGVGIAPLSNDVWVGNYGFKGSTCVGLGSDKNNSVSQFSPEGIALSPDATMFGINGNPKDGGWENGGIGWAQGTVSNLDGDIWIASCNGEMTATGQVDVTVYRNGNPDDFLVITDPNLVKPFDIAFDVNGIAWVSGTNSDNIMAFDDTGKRLIDIDLGAGSKPMGVASDSQGNVWVSLSARIDLPCPDNNVLPATDTGVAMVNINGTQINTREASINDGVPVPGGMEIAWGIAIDGNDNVWVANFRKGGVSNLCGANTANCPVGFSTGNALSPITTGYHSDLLDRNTGVEIDPAGNVWLANNWKDIPFQTDPVGDGMVVFVGMAAPVKTPLIGTPSRP